jgi:hypothetical protein
MNVETAIQGLAGAVTEALADNRRASATGLVAWMV